MDIFMYLLLGFLDVMAILVLIFKIFRFPFWEYAKKLAIIGVTLSVVSYINRYWLDIASYDMAIQFTLYILFFRYLIKIRLFDSLSIVAIGYCSFVAIQFIIYPALLMSGTVTIDDAKGLTNLGLYIIQISTEISCFLIGYLLYRFNMGFSYIFAPPHDMYIRHKKSTIRTLIASATVIGILVICSTMYWVLNFASAVYIVLPSAIGSVLILIYLSYRRDYDRKGV
ncbi:MAG TPA: hypothetical protein VGE40_09595 [Bacilli bacterium]